jgi:hypothetical protein
LAAQLVLDRREKTLAMGEVGILQDVKTHDALSSKCYLFIEHNEATFSGRLSCDSAALCQKIVKLLKQHRGKPLRFIGKLGIDFTDTEISLSSAA